MKVEDWQCNDGAADEDHDWKFILGDHSVGEGDVMECEQCGKQREPIDQEYVDAYDDSDLIGL